MQSSPSPRVLVVMRHAKAVASAAVDAERELTEGGRADAAAAGRWLVERGTVPDHALVSAASRTRQTWAALAAAAGLTLEADVDRGLYAAGPETALDLLRCVPPGARTVLLLGHNPTMATLAHLLDDGEGDPDATSALVGGFPTSAMAVLEVPGEWADLAHAAARLVACHVARG